MDENKGPGRPEETEEQLKQKREDILQKIEPYLKSGLSVRKALLEAQIPSSTFYDLMDRDPVFSEQIYRFRNFVSVLVNNSIIRELQAIIKKQNSDPPIPLTKEETAFLQWFATNSKLTRDEFGERKEVEVYDPEAEIHHLNKIIDEAVEKDKQQHAQ